MKLYNDIISNVQGVYKTLRATNHTLGGSLVTNIQTHIETFQSTVVFNMHDVLDAEVNKLWETSKADRDPFSSLIPEGKVMPLPYENFWLELDVGATLEGNIKKLGVHCVSADIKTPDNTRAEILLIYPAFDMVKVRNIVSAFVPYYFTVDLWTGKIQMRVTLSSTYDLTDMDERQREIWETATGTVCHYAIFAVAAFLRMFTCKNIVVQDVIPSKSQQKRRKTVKPLISYKTLVIDPKSKSKRSANRPHQGGTNRIHTCIGHTKTYTADKPLFGKFVGTYWWESMARGNKSKGVVHKGYEVKK